MELSELKKSYEVLSKKYKLPEFKELNYNFEIDKIERETDCLLRIIRKVMMEKIVNSINFLEMLMNPINIPRFYSNYIRNMSTSDRAKIENLYSLLSDLSLKSLLLEVEYTEKEEAQIIKDVNQKWDSIKKDFSEILRNISKPVENNIKRDKTYFG